MNGNYYKNDFIDNSSITTESDLINILKLNIGKKAKLNITIPGSNETDRLFEGIIEKVGNDYLIMSNPTNGQWYFILPIYLGYITFEEPINY